MAFRRSVDYVRGLGITGISRVKHVLVVVFELISAPLVQASRRGSNGGFLWRVHEGLPLVAQCTLGLLSASLGL